MPDPKETEKDYEQQDEGREDVDEMDIQDVEDTAELDRQPQRRDEEVDEEEEFPDRGPAADIERDIGEPHAKRDGKIGGPA